MLGDVALEHGQRFNCGMREVLLGEGMGVVSAGCPFVIESVIPLLLEVLSGK
jgi:hypothetical protein